MNRYFWGIAKWTLIGLFLRVIIMPFTLHGQDMFFINYFPMMFVQKGICDPYAFINANFPYFTFTYYGPGLFFIMSMVNFIFVKLFNITALIGMLEVAGGMLGRNFTTIDYVYKFSGTNLFANLFILKSPYLVFDFLIGALLLRFSAPKKNRLKSYKLWMLNIVVLHSVYAVGQFELIPTFFIILALFAAMKRRPYLSIISLVLGGATKVLPFIFVLPTILLLENEWKKRFLLSITALFTALALYLPFYLSSGSIIFNIFKQGRYYSGTAYSVAILLFLVAYVYICISASRDSKKSYPEKILVYYFLILCFLSYAVTPISFRYFVFVTPLLALYIPRNPRFGLYTLSLVIILAFLRLPSRSVQLGLLAPLDPEYFMGIPSAQEIIGRFINLDLLYKIMSRILALMFFAAIWLVWQAKLSFDKTGDMSYVK